ncbi:uncharacterized protein BDZ99DRAFT_484520 [Mytilinidion resinicola]|uniref:Glycoside hydrolase 131 catalytic N-terminal domain-containing protein n=1 Tax=Mytilinidion resinicola TaxID=574789 RepID=A0A6A6Z9U5_9PEZI|nr:uncharacterized protein BDZ99DRAFT_484520 [Mytilinidion resinicola]KAF2817786.1 hypothetical protein BDZ99DRAFT_484520 [Mytilinidion resinicola]
MYARVSLVFGNPALSSFVPVTYQPKRAVGAISCPIVFDGRVPVGTAATFFDTSSTLFNADYVKGANLKWSQMLQFPNVSGFRFDGNEYEAIEVTLRVGLQFASDSSTGPGTSDVKTLHLSVKQDAERPLNLTHDYLNVWHETADYSADHFMLETDTIIGSSGSDKASWKILNRSNQILCTVKVYNSAGTAALTAATGALSANISGNWQFQIGLLKKPTGTSDVVDSGYQESNLNEGHSYGRLFVEDSAHGCVTT